MPGSYDEGQHPRANDGKWTSGGGGGASDPQAKHRAYMAEIAAKAAKVGKSRQASAPKAAAAKVGAAAKAAKAASPEKAPAKTQDHAEATTASTNNAVRDAVAGDSRRAMISAPRTMDDGSNREKQWRPEAQAALRGHHNAVLAQYGLHDHDTGRPGATSVRVVGGDPLSVGYASHSGEGHVSMWSQVADHLQKHAALDGPGLSDLGRKALAGDKDALRIVDAYRVSTHEALHGHGQVTHLQSRHGTYFDEVSTELAARRVVADVHGMPLHKMEGSYARYIEPTLEAASKISGKSREEVIGAFADAALASKRMRTKEGLNQHGEVHKEDGTKMVVAMVSHAMGKLGVTDQAKHDAMIKEIDSINGEDRRKHAAAFPNQRHFDKVWG